MADIHNSTKADNHNGTKALISTYGTKAHTTTYGTKADNHILGLRWSRASRCGGHFLLR